MSDSDYVIALDPHQIVLREDELRELVCVGRQSFCGERREAELAGMVRVGAGDGDESVFARVFCGKPRAGIVVRVEIEALHAVKTAERAAFHAVAEGVRLDDDVVRALEFAVEAVDAAGQRRADIAELFRLKAVDEVVVVVFREAQLRAEDDLYPEPFPGLGGLVVAGKIEADRLFLRAEPIVKVPGEMVGYRDGVVAVLGIDADKLGRRDISAGAVRPGVGVQLDLVGIIGGVDRSRKCIEQFILLKK